MLRKLWEMAVALLTLSQDLVRYRQEQKEINEKLNNLTIIVHALAQDLKHSKDQTAQMHENLLLELENRLLKFEKALPPATASKKSAKKGSKK
jgi:regulator of replication initiation timing